MAQPESFSISAKRRISAHKPTFMAGSFPLDCGSCDGLAQDLTQLHQTLAGLEETALACRRQGKHLGKASLVGDQITGQQFVSGSNQGRQADPHQGGQRAIAVERQAVLVGHGTEEEVQEHGIA